MMVPAKRSASWKVAKPSSQPPREQRESWSSTLRCSANDFREVFKKNIEKRVRSLPEIDGLSKETVLSSWIAKYDAIYRGEEDLCKPPNRMALSAVSELILSKEQLYEMFQQILGIKKLEHQLLYNACQVSDYAISYSAV